MSILNTTKFIINHPINRGAKLGAIARFLKWQLGSRLAPGAIVYDWINGSKFLVRPGETGLTGNIYVGLHEFPDMGFLLHLLQAGDLFVDVGANVGSYTILACAAIGARGIAFEPVPDTYRRLIENMRLNCLDQKVKCINKAIGAKQGVITFTSDSDTTNHALSPGEKCDYGIIVEMTSLDIFLKNECPLLIKIDVEGYETLVLEGAQEVLRNEALQAVIMELNGSGDRYGFDEAKILDLMFSYGFKSYSYDPFSRLLIDLEGKNLRSGNTLFIRDKSFIERRLQIAPKVNVHSVEF